MSQYMRNHVCVFLDVLGVRSKMTGNGGQHFEQTPPPTAGPLGKGAFFRQPTATDRGLPGHSSNFTATGEVAAA
jgi:hypothetical protein